MAPDKHEQIRQINLHAAPLLVDMEAAREAGADTYRMAKAIDALEASVKLAKEAIEQSPEIHLGNTEQSESVPVSGEIEGQSGHAVFPAAG